MADKFKDIPDFVKQKNYLELIHVVKTMMGDLVRDMEYSRTIRHSCLKSRTKSVKLRRLLKYYRYRCLEHEKELNRQLKGS